MKEFDLPVEEAYQRGLSPDARVGRGFGRGFLAESIGLKPTPYGSRPAADLQEPFSSSQFASWPFPQLAIEQSQVLLLGEAAINLVDDSADPWTVGAALSFVEYEAPETAATLTGGGPWHFTEGLNGGIYTNGVDLLVRDNREAMFGQARVNRVSDIAVSTLTAHRGRVFYGGFNPADLWTSEWAGLFEKWLLLSPVQIDYQDQQQVSEQFVFWSSIGGGDSLWPFDPPEPEQWLDLFERNEAGFTPLPWTGSVYRLLPLGNGVVAYGDRGITYLNPITAPVTSFGLVDIAAFGIASRSAAGGDDKVHAFVASDGEVYTLTSGLELQKRGYKQFLAAGDEFVVSHDSLENDFHIAGTAGGSEFNYVLTQQGLGQSYQVPTSIARYHDDSFAVTTTTSDTHFVATTEILDFRSRDIKTVSMVEVGAQLSSGIDIEVAVDYRYSKSASFSRSPWVLVNPEGFARIQMTALEFRLVVRAPITNNPDFQPDYVNVKWQPSGRRAVRGLTSASETVR